MSMFSIHSGTSYFFFVCRKYLYYGVILCFEHLRYLWCASVLYIFVCVGPMRVDFDFSYPSVGLLPADIDK